MENKVDDLPRFQAETYAKPLISNEFSRSTTITETQKQAIRQDAERAAQERQTPNEKCPHPFSSEQGRLWVACYEAEWDKRYGLSHVFDDGGAKAYHEERRGK